MSSSSQYRWPVAEGQEAAGPTSLIFRLPIHSSGGLCPLLWPHPPSRKNLVPEVWRPDLALPLTLGGRGHPIPSTVLWIFWGTVLLVTVMAVTLFMS